MTTRANTQMKPGAADIQPRAYTMPQACRRYGIGDTSLRALIKSGKIKARRFGTRILIPSEELDNLFDSLPAA